jgi:hypothetical protein
MGSNLIEGLTKGIIERHENDEHGEHDHRGGGKGGCHSKGGADAGGGGSIFEQIAIAMGKAMDKKLDQLLDAANTVSDLSNQKAGGGGKGGQTDPSQLLQASALVTARGQELSSVSQAFNSSINSLGQAVQTAARKN